MIVGINQTYPICGNIVLTEYLITLDRLNELLDDLNGDPSLCSLIGAAPQLQENDDRNLSQLAKTEVCLTLTDKFPVPAVDRLGTDRMFVKTKQLLASVLMCTDLRSYSDSANLIGILKSKTSREQEELYWKIMAKKDQVDEQVSFLLSPFALLWGRSIYL